MDNGQGMSVHLHVRPLRQCHGPVGARGRDDHVDASVPQQRAHEEGHGGRVQRLYHRERDHRESEHREREGWGRGAGGSDRERE